MDVFEAIADPVRRSLLLQLVESGPQRVVDLTAGRGISRPAVSRHLRVLGEAGLVRGNDVGRERHYEVDVAPLQVVTTLVERLSRSRPSAPITDVDLDALDLEVRRTVRDVRRTKAGSDPTEETA